MSKTILAKVGGFTPIIDKVAKDTCLMSAVVFGRMWRYSQMKDAVCKASLKNIAEELNISPATVMRHTKKLCAAGYLKDLTPGLRNRPHVYVDTGKAGRQRAIVKNNDVAESKSGVAESQSGVAESNVGVAESQLNRVFKRESKREFKRRKQTFPFREEEEPQIPAWMKGR